MVGYLQPIDEDPYLPISTTYTYHLRPIRTTCNLYLPPIVIPTTISYSYNLYLYLPTIVIPNTCDLLLYPPTTTYTYHLRPISTTYYLYLPHTTYNYHLQAIPTNCNLYPPPTTYSSTHQLPLITYIYYLKLLLVTYNLYLPPTSGYPQHFDQRNGWSVFHFRTKTSSFNVCPLKSIKKVFTSR